MEIRGLNQELYNSVIAVARFAVDQYMHEIKVTRDDFNKLREAVEKLTEAQAKADERLTRVEIALEKLTEAQAKADERLTRLEIAVEKLTEAQTKTDERLTRLEIGLEKTDERLTRLEIAVEKLTQAQTKTDESIKKLAEAQARTEVALKSLSDNIGFGLEDIAHVVLPGYLQRHYEIYIEKFERTFFPVKGGEVEVNLYATGKRNGNKITVIGECKSRIYSSDVRKFLRNIAKITPNIKTELVKIMFGYLIHPSASEMAQKEDIILVASYQR